MVEENKVLGNDDTTNLNENLVNEEEQININLQADENLQVNNDLQKDVEEFVKKNKKSSLKKILFGLIVFLLLLIVIGVILFLLGFFTHEEKKEEIKPLEQKQEMTKKEEESYKFDIKDINSKKLNEQLASLTNKNLNQEKNEELEKKEDEKRLIEEQKKKEEELLTQQEATLQREKAALEEKKLQLENEKAELETLKQQALMVKEELLSKQDIETAEKVKDIEQKGNTNHNKKENMTNESNINDIFLKFISVAKIKGELYKKYLDRVVAINPNIILCRDDKNRIEIYYGPFNDENTRKDLLEKLIKNKFSEAYELEFTKEEFDIRCNY